MDSNIDPRLLDELEKTQPELVQQYRAKMAGSNEAMQQAQGAQDMGNYGNVAGRAFNDFNNSQKSDLILKNRWQDLGKSPSIREADRPKYDDSVINKVTAQGVDRAQQQRQTDQQDFSAEQKLTDMQPARDLQAKSNDPMSDESVQARDALKMAVPGAAKISNFDNMTAAQVQKIAPQLMEAAKFRETIASRKDESALRSEDRKAAYGNQATTKQNQAYTDLNNHINTPRGNSAVQQAQQALRNVQNAQELIDQYPDTNQMPPDKVSLLNAEIAKIASGGVATEHGTKSLEANTLMENVARFQQRVSNKPSGAQLGEFIKQNKNYLDGLYKVNKEFINDYQRKVYSGYKNRIGPDLQHQFETENSDLFDHNEASGSPKTMHGSDLP